MTEPKKVKTAVIYARYSEGPRQTDQSIEGQVADCLAYADRNDIRVLDVYADRHISGKSIDGRYEFQRMLRDAQSHLFEAVIVWKIDRFGRNRTDIAISKMKLREAGVKLLYAEESVPDGPEGIILESVLEGLAEYYSADLRQKVRRGIRETAKKGEYTGASVPIGYKRDKNRHVIIDPYPAEAIRECFRIHNSGGTMTEIMEMFAARGILALHGKPVGKSVVNRILRNPRYCGEWEFAGVPLDVEPIISRDVFMEAQNHYKTSRNNAAGRAQVKYYLSGKCFCGICGDKLHGYTGTGRSGKKYHYYRCVKKTDRNCDLPIIPKDRLEDSVFEATVQNCLNPDVIDQITKKVLELHDSEQAASPDVALRAQLKDINKKIDGLITQISMAPHRLLTEALDRLEQEKISIEDKILAAELKKPRLTEDLVRSWLNSFRDGDITDPVFRQKLADTFVCRVDVFYDRIVVYFNITDDSDPDACLRTDRLLDQAALYTNTPVFIYPFIILSVPFCI